jgi:transcriptional regulator with XRE-family HTH domain
MNIYMERKALGWTQAQLAEQLGVHHSIISRMERQEIPINLRTLIALEVIFKRAKEQ